MRPYPHGAYSLVGGQAFIKSYSLLGVGLQLAVGTMKAHGAVRKLIWCGVNNFWELRFEEKVYTMKAQGFQTAENSMCKSPVVSGCLGTTSGEVNRTKDTRFPLNNGKPPKCSKEKQCW
jgi:hypothetical protein